MAGHKDLVEFIRQRQESSIIYEPRGYFDVIELSQVAGGRDGPWGNFVAEGASPNINTISERVSGHFDALRNGEAFPVTLTHITFATGYLDQEDAVEDERELQRIGVRFKYHDDYYINKWGFAAPMWANKVGALSDAGSYGSSSWRFNDGKHVKENGGGSFILPERGTLQVDVQCAATPSDDIIVHVVFTGIGMLSYRPYLLSSTGTFTAALGANQVHTLIPNDLRNDGTEPILITDMMLNITGPEDESPHIGDIRQLSLNVRCMGAGTGAAWFSGPVTPVPIDRCPAALLGITTGRAVVHELPKPYVWMPGDGITIEANGIFSPAFGALGAPDSYLNVGIFGYTEVG